MTKLAKCFKHDFYGALVKQLAKICCSPIHARLLRQSGFKLCPRLRPWKYQHLGVRLAFHTYYCVWPPMIRSQKGGPLSQTISFSFPASRHIRLIDSNNGVSVPGNGVARRPFRILKSFSVFFLFRLHLYFWRLRPGHFQAFLCVPTRPLFRYRVNYSALSLSHSHTLTLSYTNPLTISDIF